MPSITKAERPWQSLGVLIILPTVCGRTAAHSPVRQHIDLEPRCCAPVKVQIVYIIVRKACSKTSHIEKPLLFRAAPWDFNRQFVQTVLAYVDWLLWKFTRICWCHTGIDILDAHVFRCKNNPGMTLSVAYSWNLKKYDVSQIWENAIKPSVVQKHSSCFHVSRPTFTALIILKN